MGLYKRLALVFVVITLDVAHQNVNFKRSGWLARVVEQRKAQFLKDVGTLPPIQIKATLIQAPKGYEDPPGWDFKSVVRLLFLIRQSKESRPVFRQLRRMLSPVTRRLYSVNKAYSYLAFPNIDAKNYYDHAYFSQEYMDNIHLDDLYHVNNTLDDNSVIIVSNPVEARLPSARISVLMLKQIMEARALGNRVMPTTPKPTIPWPTMNHTTSSGSGNDTNPTGSGGDSDSTGGSGGDSDSTGEASTGGGGGDGNSTDASDSPNSTSFFRKGEFEEEDSESEEITTTTKKKKLKSGKKGKRSKNLANKIKKKSRKSRLSRKQNDNQKQKMTFKEHEKYLEQLAVPRNWWNT